MVRFLTIPVASRSSRRLFEDSYVARGMDFNGGTNSTPRRCHHPFEESADLFDRELHRGVADVEFEALQPRPFGVVGSPEHPNSFFAGYVQYPGPDGVNGSAHAYVHHRALDRKGEDLDAVDSLQDARNLLCMIVVTREAIATESQRAEGRRGVGPESEGAPAVAAPPKF